MLRAYYWLSTQESLLAAQRIVLDVEDVTQDSYMQAKGSICYSISFAPLFIKDLLKTRN